MMSSWDNLQSKYGEQINSTHASLAKKDRERARIEELTATYLLTKQITQIPYGVRTDLPKWE
jgi:hypothetical protein